MTAYKTRTKFDIADFTRENYRALINLAKKNYVFVNYGKEEQLKELDNVVLWRHDVDYSPNLP